MRRRGNARYRLPVIGRILLGLRLEKTDFDRSRFGNELPLRKVQLCLTTIQKITKGPRILAVLQDTRLHETATSHKIGDWLTILRRNSIGSFGKHVNSDSCSRSELSAAEPVATELTIGRSSIEGWLPSEVDILRAIALGDVDESNTEGL